MSAPSTPELVNTGFGSLFLAAVAGILIGVGGFLVKIARVGARRRMK